MQEKKGAPVDNLNADLLFQMETYVAIKSHIKKCLRRNGNQT